MRRLAAYVRGEHLAGLAGAARCSLLSTSVFFYTRATRAPGRVRARGRVATVLALGLVVFTGVALNVVRPAQTVAATNDVINFQARLESNAGAIVPDGNYNVEFKLYSASSGGTALWTEDYLNSASQGIEVANGYLTANLGSITSFPGTINWDQQLWLTMNIGGTTGGSPSYDGEMSPRLQLTALPYAFRAGKLADPANSGSLLDWNTQSGAHAIHLPDEAGTLCIQSSTNCGFASSTGSGSYIQNGTSPQTADFNITGTGTIGGLLTGSSGLTITGGTANINASGSGATNIGSTGSGGAVVIQSASTIALTSGTTLSLTSTGSNAININPGGGSNTGLFVQPTADSTKALQIQNHAGTSNLFVADTTNTRIGIGVASPAATLNVQGFQPSGNGTTAADSVLTVAGGKGQNLNTAGTAGTGAAVGITGGAGGDNTASSGAFIGGLGGALTLTGGAGGQVTNSGAGNAGGAGGDIALVGGAGFGSINTTYGGNGGNISIQGGAGGSAGAGSGSRGAVNIQTTGSGNVTVGNTSNTGTLTLGQSTQGETISIGNGNVASGKTNTINIGATATSTGKDVITIGSTVAASTLTLQGGNTSSAVSIQSAASGTINIATANAANTVQIGNIANAVTQSINIGNNTTGSSVSNVTIGSTVAGTTTLQNATAIALNAPAVTTNATTLALFNTTATTINFAGAASTAINIGPASTTATSINLAGGSADTGCTVAGDTGNLTCSGNFVSGSNQAFVQNGNSMGATAVLGTNDSNSLAFETGGTTKWLIDTTGNLLPNVDDTYNIGSDTARVANIYLGGETVHLGASTSDEATISYNNTSDSLIFKNATNSATAFQIQNASAGSVLNVNTTSSIVTIGIPTMVYQGGADASGSTNTGTTSLSFQDFAVSGQYAFVASGGNATACSQAAGSAVGCEIKVFNISNPAAPAYVGGVDANGSTTGATNRTTLSATISGRYLYVTFTGNATACSQTVGSAGGCELEIFDISNPAAPAYVGGADASGSANTGTGNVNFTDITISGSYAYIASASNNTACSQTVGSAIGCELKVFDISNPAAPAYVGGADATGSTNSGTGNTSFNSTTVSGNYAYVTSANSSTTCSATVSAIGCELKAFDISNPAAPTYVGGADVTGSTNTGAGNLSGLASSMVNGYLYVTFAGSSTACSQTAGSAIGCELKVFNVSNPATPTYVGGVDADGSTTGTSSVSGGSNLVTAGRYAYTLWGSSATNCSQTAGSAEGCEIKAFNISNPVAPTYVGGADASGSANTGTGSLFPTSIFLSGAYLYTGFNGNTTTCSATAGSAIGCELKDFSISGIDSPALTSDNISTASLQVTSNGQIYGDLSIQGGLSVSQNTLINGSLGVGGSVLFKNSVNSTTAFQVQNAAGNNYIQVDTSGANLNLGNTGIANTVQIGNTSGAVAQTINIGNSSTASSTNTVNIGSQIGTSPITIKAGTSGVIFNPVGGSSNNGVLIQPASDTTEAFRVLDSGGGVALYVDTSGTHDQVGVGAAPAASTKLYVESGSYNVITANGTGSNDLLHLQSSGTDVVTVGNTGNATFQNSTDSTTAFQIQLSDSTPLFTADTTNGEVHIGPTAAVGNELYVQSNSDTVIRGKNTGSADLLQLANNTADVFTVANAGNTTIKTTTNSNTAFQVQNTSGDVVLGVDTSNYRVGIGNNGYPPDSTLTIHSDGQNATVNIYGVSSGTDYGAIQVSSEGDLSNSSARALELQPNGGSVIVGSATGTNSTTEFQVQDSSGNSVFNVNTSGKAITLFAGVTGGTLTSDIAGTATTHGVCHSGAASAAANVQFVVCTTPVGADYAELYPSQPDVTPGDVVMTTSTYATSKDGKYQVPVVAKTDGAYESAEIGVISEIDPHSDESNLTGNNVNDSDYPMPVALNGRVLTKVNTENGDIVAGDYITASSTPGVGMKATAAGEVIGRAMQSYSGSGTGQILIFVNPFYYSGPSIANTIQNGGDATLGNLTVSGLATVNDIQANGTATVNNLLATTANVQDLTSTSSTTDSLTANSLNVNGDANVGNLIASGQVTANDLQVNGSANIADLTAINLTATSLSAASASISGTLGVSGAITAGSLNVSGSATVGSLTVTGSAQFDGDITIGGHVITAGGQPTSQAQAAAGGSATISVDGTDTTGTITITTGSAPTAGDLAKILFSKTYGQAPHIVLSPSNDKAAGLRFFKGATSATDFMFNALDAPQANTTYTFDYSIAQ